ncbi:MAG: radical SAM protein, partial [Desulfurococcales archaeon]|nr:radical SAM protein [Desulfurococcales archaeon]
MNVVKLGRWKRLLVNIEEPLPLVGTVFIGVIDRGTNVLQVRPTTLCPLNCIFCSVDAGP